MIAVAANFTAEPVADSLRYWLDALGIAAEIRFAPFNQVFQSLLDPAGLFASNLGGLNVVLWRVDHSGDELVDALRSSPARMQSPIFVCACPGDPAPKEETALAGLSGIRFLSSQHLSELYPVASPFDLAADTLGQMPYSAPLYAALGTAIARAFHATRRSPFKAIVLDCDNTLWRGVCGELGAGGVKLDRASLAVQRFVKARQAEGMLLCVASKNALQDVSETFHAHPEMPLQEDDIVAWRVNWRPKAENIRSLAEELSLSLDAFVFLDDNPMETAEVASACPGVLTLTIPADLELVPRFLDHLWAFDTVATTAEDMKRTEMYRENALRNAALARSISYVDFLASLELVIEIRGLCGGAELERAAQMTQRTNQFNFTTRRMSAIDIGGLLQNESIGVLTVFVRDRFGDYGQSGLIVYHAMGDTLRVLDFLLSCRVLGKGVEHAMVARLGSIAADRSLAWVAFSFERTAKNMPAFDFLKSLCGGGDYRLSASEAASVRMSVHSQEPNPAKDVPREPLRRVPDSRLLDYVAVAERCLDMGRLVMAIDTAREVHRNLAGTPRARTQAEQELTHIWESVLRVSPIGPDDDFFDLGGDSIRAVQVLAAVQRQTGRLLPLSTLIEAPTIAQLALRLEAKDSRWRHLVALKPSGMRPAFFCVHGVGGNVLDLVDLARRVDEDQPFYGLQAASEDRLSVEAIASRYLQEVREFQPTGPYYLGGSSYGGLIAYEMARQLSASGERHRRSLASSLGGAIDATAFRCGAFTGEKVAMVAMFDTSVPGVTDARRTRLDEWRYRCSLHWHNLLVLRNGERVRYLRGKLARPFSGGEVTNAIRERLRAMKDAGQWAASSYRPREYAGTVTLFRATMQPPWIAGGRTLGWGDLARDVVVYDTPGHHADLVRDPRARVLAQQLTQALAQTTGHLPSAVYSRSL